MSCQNDYTAGDMIALTLSVASKETGDPVNATTISLEVKDPNGNVTDISGSVINPATGRYEANYVAPNVLGLYRYQWKGTGTATFADVRSFQVTQLTF